MASDDGPLATFDKTRVPLRCRCSLVRGSASGISPGRGQRIVCYCDDCQAYARFLGRDGIVDEWGGTDVVQLSPSQVEITAGKEHLSCVRLSEKGLMRWFAGCCGTPIGNTLASPRVPFIGVMHCFMDHEADGRSRDEVIGPIRARTQGRFAPGGLPPGGHRTAPLGVVATSAYLLLVAWLTKRHRPSSFFDAVSGLPVVAPRVLTSDERDELRPR